MLSFKFRLSSNLANVTSLCLMSYLVILPVICLGFITDGGSVLGDEFTVALCMGMGSYLLLYLKTARQNLFEASVVLSLFFIIYILPRTLAYILFPNMVSFPFGSGVGSREVNTGLFYIFAGTVMMTCGMKITNILWRTCFPYSFHKPCRPQGYKMASLGILFFLVFMVNFYFTHILEITPYGKMQADNYNSLIQVLKVCFEFDAAFRIVFAAILLKIISGDKRKWWILLALAVFYVGDRSFAGSRVGMLRVLWAFLAALIVIRPHYNLKIFRYALVGWGLCIIAFALYPVATSIRDRITYSHYDLSVKQEEPVEEDGRVYKALSSGLNRLGCVLDYPILIITQPYDKEAKEKYMNLTYPMKNIINNIMPGNPYSEAEIMTSRVIDILFRGASEKDMYAYYNSEYWTVWGLTHIMFGSGWGLLVMLILGVGFQALYLLIIKLFQGNVQLILKLWFVFYVFTGFIGNMGIDDGFITAFQGLIQFIISMVTLYLFDKGFEMFKTSGATMLRAKKNFPGRRVFL